MILAPHWVQYCGSVAVELEEAYTLYREGGASGLYETDLAERILGGTGRDADAHVRVTTFLAYFSDFLSNIKVFCQNNVFFELLRQK